MVGWEAPGHQAFPTNACTAAQPTLAHYACTAGQPTNVQDGAIAKAADVGLAAAITVHNHIALNYGAAAVAGGGERWCTGSCGAVAAWRYVEPAACARRQACCTLARCCGPAVPWCRRS